MERCLNESMCLVVYLLLFLPFSLTVKRRRMNAIMSVNASDTTSSQWLCSEARVVLLRGLFPYSEAAVASFLPLPLWWEASVPTGSRRSRSWKKYLSLSLGALSDGWPGVQPGEERTLQMISETISVWVACCVSNTGTHHIHDPDILEGGGGWYLPSRIYKGEVSLNVSHASGNSSRSHGLKPSVRESLSEFNIFYAPL